MRFLNWANLRHVVKPLDHSARTPLSRVLDVSNILVMNAATWRRQSRNTTGIDVIMEDTVGSKRSTSNMGSQPELQKKRKIVSQGVKNNTKILAAAESQPRQNQ